jgi:uncharacterized membrane protein
MNVLQVLATTSILFVVFAIVWVFYVEEWLEQRELQQTRRTAGESRPADEQTQRGDDD